MSQSATKVATKPETKVATKFNMSKVTWSLREVF